MPAATPWRRPPAACATRTTGSAANAAIALRHAAAPAAETVPALVEMLGDENRYNRFYAADGLRRLAPASPEAEAGLMDHLFTSRWCPLTTPESLY